MENVPHHPRTRARVRPWRRVGAADRQRRREPAPEAVPRSDVVATAAGIQSSDGMPVEADSPSSGARGSHRRYRRSAAAAADSRCSLRDVHRSWDGVRQRLAADSRPSRGDRRLAVVGGIRHYCRTTEHIGKEYVQKTWFL